MLATTIDALNIPPLWYPVVQHIQAASAPPSPNYLDRLGIGFNYPLGTSSTFTMETTELPKIVRDAVAEAFKPKTEFGKRLLALRRAYVEKGGKLLADDELDEELRQRRGGVTNA